MKLWDRLPSLGSISWSMAPRDLSKSITETAKKPKMRGRIHSCRLVRCHEPFNQFEIAVANIWIVN